jgi:alpha-D-xyloside xylohydrolase
MTQIYPGVWKITLGDPEADTPLNLCTYTPKLSGLEQMSAVAECPIREDLIVFRKVKRGMVLEIPMGADEQIYGLGLQLGSFNQRKRKKMLRVNSDPRLDLGDSHAPVPFYVSTAGYGVLVDTARYTTFTFGGTAEKKFPGEEDRIPKGKSYPPDSFYNWVTQDRGGPVLVEIPASAGVDLYIFAGPTMRAAVQRYNLFSGGGCLPPRWGLGVWYRTSFGFGQEQVVAMAQALRAEEMPCDVLGLEPGWQSHAYPCSHTWNNNFPDPAGLIRRLDGLNYHANLWTHAYTHPTSPVYEALYPYSGDYAVLGGLVPDLIGEKAREILGAIYQREHVDLGVSGYKLDECDNSDYNGVHWMFPEASQFPSGTDGEVMHSLFGMKFQEMILDLYRKRGLRTYGNTRSSYALAAPQPFVLYSDLYNHKEFIRGMVNSGFSGLLWTPEVRDADSEEDLIRRLQVAALSPQALINAWYINNPPWKQWRRAENNRGEFLPDGAGLQAACKQVLDLRMQLIPYLYAAFYRYHQEGIPPFRALVLDWPDDANTYGIDDAWMIGDRLLAAPVTSGEQARSVYLPAGQWYDFWTGDAFAGGQHITVDVPLDHIPLFVSGGAVLPLARETMHTADPASLELEARVYGDGAWSCLLFEDDGMTLANEQGEFNRLELSWDAERKHGSVQRSGAYIGLTYQTIEWKVMGTR